MKHPNTDFVLQTVNTILGDHVFKSCQVKGARFDVMSSSYVIACSNVGVTVELKVPSERFDVVEKSNDKSSRRPIKRALKAALKIELTPDD